MLEITGYRENLIDVCRLRFAGGILDRVSNQRLDKTQDRQTNTSLFLKLHTVKI